MLSSCKGNEAFHKKEISSEFGKSRHFEWEILDKELKELFSEILGREIKVTSKREDFYFWSIKILNSSFSEKEMDLLLSAVGANDYDRKEYLLLNSAEEISQGLAHKIVNQMLPFEAVSSFADDEGIWFISADIKLFFFTMKIANRDGRQIATRTGAVYAKDKESASEKVWEKYGGETQYALDVWEIKGDIESFCTYSNSSGG